MTDARWSAAVGRGLLRASLALVVLACFTLAGVEGALAAEAGGVPLPQAVLLDGDGLDSDQLKGLYPPAAHPLALPRSGPSAPLPSPVSRLASSPAPAAPFRILPLLSSLRGPPSS